MRSAAATCQKTVQVPIDLDTVAAASLFEALTSRVGAGLVIDGCHVERICGLCLQVPLAALSTWKADEMTLQFSQLSSDLVAGLELLGIRPQYFPDRELSQ